MVVIYVGTGLMMVVLAVVVVVAVWDVSGDVAGGRTVVVLG